MKYWKIYYDDGKTYSSEDGIWNDAPLDGVLFVLEVQEDGKVNIHSGNDFYYLDEDTVASTGDINPFLRKLRFIKFGRWTSHKRMEQAAALVREDTKKW